MMVKLSHLYTEPVWDAMRLPRKFFIQHRGFGPTHTRGDLPSFRKLFLRWGGAGKPYGVHVKTFSYSYGILKFTYTCKPQPSTLNPKSQTLHSKTSTVISVT
jgi:hypothetical protein